MSGIFSHLVDTRLFFSKWILGIWVLWSIWSISGTNVLGSPVTDDGTRWVGIDLVGPVHIVRGTESNLHQVGNDWVEEEPHHEWTRTFDREQTFLEIIHFKPMVPGLSPRSFLCFTRDRNNRIVRAIDCDAQKRPTDTFENEFSYDALGHLIEYRVSNLIHKDPADARTVYEYDAAGRKTTRRMYSLDGTLSTLTTFQYEKNRLTVHMRTVTGEFQAKEIYTLDSAGHTTEVVSLDDKDGVISHTRLRYDDHGRRIERISSGRGVERQEIDSYEYDERGNWTKKSSRIIEPTGEERSITRRVIEYFTQ